MNKNDIKMITDEAESLDWTVSIEDNNFTFSQYSSGGRDFSFEVQANTLEDLAKEINEYYENFDVSYETYIYLDDEGHGINGAPYDMRDLYNDTEEIREMIESLYCAINKIT